MGPLKKDLTRAGGGEGVRERSGSFVRVLRVLEALGGSFVRVLRVREALGGSFVRVLRVREAHLYVFYVSWREEGMGGVQISRGYGTEWVPFLRT